MASSGVFVPDPGVEEQGIFPKCPPHLQFQENN